MDGAIPVDVLERLPEWCVNVETPGRGMHGFFAHLEWDPNDSRRELRLLVDADEGLSPRVIHLGPGRTLEDGLQAVAERCTQRARDLGIPFRPEDFHVSPRGLAPMVSVVLYLCSVGSDVQTSKGNAWPPERPSPKRTRQGLRVFPPPGPTFWETGWRIGAALRAAAVSTESSRPRPEGSPDSHPDTEPIETRSTPVPHIRRAHWHLYWTCPRSGEQTPRLKWLPPIPVNLDLAPAVPTVRPVR